MTEATRAIQYVLISTISAILLFPSIAKSDAYNIDLTGALSSIGLVGGPVPNTGYPEGELTAVYSVQPGDIVNFGTLYLSPYSTDSTSPGPGSNTYEYVFPPSLFVYFYGGPYGAVSPPTSLEVPGGVLDQCLLAEIAGCTAILETTYTTTSLDFTIPSGATSVQLAWTDPSEYVAPTPLPAAFPLFATGLGALGLLGWRRKRKLAQISN